MKNLEEGKYWVTFIFIDEFDKEKRGSTFAIFKNGKWRNSNDSDDFHGPVISYSKYNENNN